MSFCEKFVVRLFAIFLALCLSLGFSQDAYAAPVVPGSQIQAPSSPEAPEEAPQQNSFMGPASVDAGDLIEIISFVMEDNRKDFATRKEEFKTDIKGDECMTCLVFQNFAVAVFKPLASVNASGPDFIPIMVMFAQLYALFVLGKGLIIGNGDDLVARWQVFYRLCLMVALVSFILQAPVTLIWQIVYNPILLLGGAIAQTVGSFSSSCGIANMNVYPEQAKTVLDMMFAGTCTAWDITLDGMATGLALMTTRATILSILYFGIAGLIIVLIYGWLVITFPLKFIDIIVRLAIVSIVTPVLVLAFTFKETRGYAMTAVSMVLNAAMQFALFMIILVMGKKVFEGLAQILFISTDAETGVISVLVNSLAMVVTASIFAGLLKSVPALASEISKSSSGGNEGSNAAIGTIAKPLTVGATATGTAVGLGGRGAIRMLRNRGGGSGATS